jgi:hypothetical protein
MPFLFHELQYALDLSTFRRSIVLCSHFTHLFSLIFKLFSLNAAVFLRMFFCANKILNFRLFTHSIPFYGPILSFFSFWVTPTLSSCCECGWVIQKSNKTPNSPSHSALKCYKRLVLLSLENFHQKHFFTRITHAMYHWCSFSLPCSSMFYSLRQLLSDSSSLFSFLMIWWWYL